MKDIDYIKSLSSLDEIFTYIHRNNVNFTDDELREFQDYVIRLDQRGKWCVLLAERFGDRLDLRKIEDAVIKKDKTGQFSYLLCKVVKGIDKEKMRKAIAQKDTTGIWLRKLDELDKR